MNGEYYGAVEKRTVGYDNEKFIVTFYEANNKFSVCDNNDCVVTYEKMRKEIFQKAFPEYDYNIFNEEVTKKETFSYQFG